MNIVFINSIGKNKWGGGEKWMIMAASGLISLGHNVVAICRKKSRLAQKAKQQQIHVKEIDNNSDLDFIACIKFCRFFKSFNPDVIIGCQNKDWRVASLALKIIGSEAKVYARQGLQQLKNKWWYKWSVKTFCHGIITNTYSIKEVYDSFLPVEPDFVKVVYNGVEEIPQNIEPFDYSRYLPANEKNPLIILTTGRLAKQKGFKYLIDAAAQIIKKHSNAYFFLAGQGKLEKKLKRQINQLGISKNFILLGFFDNIHPLLEGADVFVFSSLYEGMPNAVLEAMAHGLVVVSTNVNGISEIIHPGVNGYTVNPENTQELFLALENVINKRKDIFQIGQKAKQFVSQSFPIQGMVKKLDELLCDDFLR
ncbi:glycosyltransferase [Thermophagus xiamenensis]|uniref:Glycosyltransferase involved in cell wall bisynthesis n=1 Tax=Thermophagus xiamenensis TaxID=385682 RepID=A0A1I2CEY9_9BACT|nr:glycosyltransferase [Thermophagus xiamenensis]SFE66866.1 Glycosyltransferase involved in cell wall bisynthesis [Thermophagus xiamenensis]